MLVEQEFCSTQKEMKNMLCLASLYIIAPDYIQHQALLQPGPGASLGTFSLFTYKRRTPTLGSNVGRKGFMLMLAIRSSRTPKLCCKCLNRPAEVILKTMCSFMLGIETSIRDTDACLIMLTAKLEAVGICRRFLAHGDHLNTLTLFITGVILQTNPHGPRTDTDTILIPFRNCA